MPEMLARQWFCPRVRMVGVWTVLMLSTALAHAAGHGKPASPVAEAGAVVRFGNARFTVLTDRLVRMEWAADGRFEDRASLAFINRRLPVPHYTQEHQNGVLELRTACLALRYHPSGDGKLTAENLSVDVTCGTVRPHWVPGQADDANLLGTIRTLDGSNGAKLKEPMEQGLVSRSGWSVVDDSSRPLFDHDFPAEKAGSGIGTSPLSWPWAVARPEGPRQDLYFFGYGHDYRAALADFTRVAGKIPLPPKFAFGVWWSRYWAYSDQDLLGMVSAFAQHALPLDVVVVDMDWHVSQDQLVARGLSDLSKNKLGWTGYSWNRILFPDPEGFLQRMHDAGVKVSLNLHPASGVQPWEDRYREMEAALRLPADHGPYIPFAPTDPHYVDAYFSVLHRPLEKQGVDFWWLDWQQQNRTDLPGLNPTWWLNYLHFMEQASQGARPLVFHRWGGLGNHRYQIGFSGDTHANWASLAFQPWFTATAANVGYAYWSHDIGGHAPGAVGPELYTRWIQFGVYSPVFRTHTTKNPDAERRVWAYPEPYSDIMQDAIRRRALLFPYLYTEARRTYDTGVAFLHPLYYDWPENDEAYATRGEYVFGEQMVVAPVTAPSDPRTGLAEQTLWIPPGPWIDASSGARLEGPRLLKRHYTLEQTPVLVKEGAIVPQRVAATGADASLAARLGLEVWPLSPGQSSRYDVYDDTGQGTSYQNGVSARLPIQAFRSADGSDLRIVIGPVQGASAPTRVYELRLPADLPPQSVRVNGHPLAFTDRVKVSGWRYDGNTLTTIIPVAASTVRKPVVIEIYRSPVSEAASAGRDGFQGRLILLRAAYDALAPFERLHAAPDALVLAMQTGDRMAYHPASAPTELASFNGRVSDAQSAVAAHADMLAKAVDQKLRQLFYGIDRHDAQAMAERAAILHAVLNRARSLMTEAVSSGSELRGG